MLTGREFQTEAPENVNEWRKAVTSIPEIMVFFLN